MPQNKNLTQICFPEGGFGNKNGVNDERKKGACQGSQQAVSTGREKRQDQDP